MKHQPPKLSENMDGREARRPEFKIAFVGDASVGKTSIIMRYHHGQFTDSRQPTIGSAFVSRQIAMPQGEASLLIWDTAGEERYRSLVPMYSRGSAVCVVVFDITDPSTFESLPDWVSKMNEEVRPKCNIVVAANKCDLPEVVSRTDIEAWAKANEVTVIYVSAKTGEGIDNLFGQVVGSLPQATFTPKGQELLDDGNGGNERKGGCCG